MDAHHPVIRAALEREVITKRPYLPPGWSVVPKAESAPDVKEEVEEYECTGCRGTGEGQFEGQSCGMCRGKGF